MNLSYWEIETYLKNIDVIIVGSGIVGLNAALNLKNNNPKLKIAIIERGLLPMGASSKNAGFACFGSASELLDDLNNSPEEQVLSLVEKRWKGLARLRKNLGDKNIDFHQWGGYEIFDDKELFSKCADKLAFFNKSLASIIGKNEVFKINSAKIQEFGLKGAKYLIENCAEGQIDTGKMIFNLINLVQQKEVIILNGIEVKSIEKNGNLLTLKTSLGYDLQTKRLLIATNGFAKQLSPKLEVLPARAQVLVTSPIKNLRIKGTFHYDRGYFYFRNIENRILLGGGRNLDFKTEETTDFGLTSIVQEKLDDLLKNVILPDADYKIEHRWSGIMGVGPAKRSIVKEISKNIFCAVRMGGMGVAIGSLVGEEAADLILNS